MLRRSLVAHVCALALAVWQVAPAYAGHKEPVTDYNQVQGIPATGAQAGVVKPDGTTITNNNGAISTTYGTAAQGNDTRFPASVIGLRKAAGVGSADAAAVPGTDFVPPTQVATTSKLGLVQIDNSTVTINGSGVLSIVLANVVNALGFAPLPRAAAASQVAAWPLTQYPLLVDGYAAAGDGGRKVMVYDAANACGAGGHPAADGVVCVNSTATNNVGSWNIDLSASGGNLAPEMFGADRTGANESAAAFQNAGVAAGRLGGGKVTYCGRYKVSAVAVTASNVAFEGCGGTYVSDGSAGGAVILQTSATANTFAFGNGTLNGTRNSGVRNTYFMPASGVVRTGGAAVQCKFTFKCFVEGSTFASQFYALDLYGSAVGKFIYNYISGIAACPTNAPEASGFTTSNYSAAIWDHGTAAINSIADDIANNFIGSPTAGCYGIYLGANTQGETVRANGVQNMYVNGLVTNVAGNGDPVGTSYQHFFQHNQWDATATSASSRANCPAAEQLNSTFKIRTNGTFSGGSTETAGQVSDLQMDDEWYATSFCGSGVAVVSDSAPIYDLHWSKPRSLNNWLHGMLLQQTGSTLHDIAVANPMISGNSDAAVGSYNGVDIEGAPTHIDITGGSSGRGNTAYGVSVNGTADWVYVSGTDLSQNQAGCAVLGGSTGTHNFLADTNQCNGTGLTVPYKTFTPTLSCSSGTLGSGNGASGRARKVGATVYVEYQISIGSSGVGSCTTANDILIATLPSGFTAASNQVLAGRENQSTGKQLQGLITAGGTSVGIINFDNSTAVANNTTFYMSGYYETSAQ